MDIKMAVSHFQVLSCGLQQEMDPETLKVWMEKNLLSRLSFAQNHELSLIGIQQMEVFRKHYLLDPLSKERMDSDYLQLFIGAGHPMAPPWGSYYLNERQMLFQEETMEVKRWMRRYGWAVPGEKGVPEDFLAYELSFTAHLLQKMYCTWDQEKSDEIREDLLLFLDEQILSWLLQWNQKVQLHAKTEFYQSLGNLVQGACETLRGKMEV